jgi:Prokaryotic N-terminal methylation motif
MNQSHRINMAIQLPNSTRQRRLPRKRRRAMTLVEVSVSVALTALLIGVATSLLVGLKKWDYHFRDHSTQSDQLQRLSEMIRVDLRQATDVLQPSKKILAITGGNGDQIRYEITPDGCQRIENVPLSTPEKSDLFRIEPNSLWQINKDSSGRRPAIVVTLERSSQDDLHSTITRMLIRANLGADLAPDSEKAPPDQATSSKTGAAS